MPRISSSANISGSRTEAAPCPLPACASACPFAPFSSSTRTGLFTSVNNRLPRACTRSARFFSVFAFSCIGIVHFYLCNRLKNRKKLLRNYCVSETFKSVHPIGNPMSHSTHVGFNWPPTTTSKLGPPSPCFCPAARAFCAFGVGNIAATASKRA